MTYALITGASKGIGKAIASEMAKRKINLLLVARDKELLARHATQLMQDYGIQAAYLAIDLSTPNAASELLDWVTEKSYPLQFLINNAGYGLSGSFEKYGIEAYKNMLQLNVIHLIELTYKLLPLLKKHNGSSYIMNIASTAAYQAVPGLSAYAASKAFVLSFSRGLRYELSQSNISITAICPGPTDTDFSVRANVNSPKALQLAKTWNMQPEAVAKIAVKAMFQKKAEKIPGSINKITAWGANFLPKKWIEQMAAAIYDL